MVVRTSSITCWLMLIGDDGGNRKLWAFSRTSALFKRGTFSLSWSTCECNPEGGNLYALISQFLSILLLFDISKL